MVAVRHSYVKNEKGTTRIKRIKDFFVQLRKRVHYLGQAFYRAERILVTLLRGRIFFQIGKFIRYNGSLTAVILIAHVVIATNIYAQSEQQLLKGYWKGSAENRDERLKFAASDDDGLALEDTTASDDIAQIALSNDAETRKEGERSDTQLTTGSDDALLSDDTTEANYGDGYNGEQIQDEIKIYTVKDGDTLSIIAQANDVTVNTLLWANDIADEDDISPGDTLFILPVAGVKHVVKSSDTITKIAKEYKAEEKDIIEYNTLPANGEIKQGQELIIPGGEIEPPPAPIAPRTQPSTIIPRRTYVSGSGFFTHPAPGSRKTQGLHPTNAVDLAAPLGSPIYAAAAGTVTKVTGSGWGGGYGKHVVISHPNGVITLYAHLSRIHVKKGEKVKKGENIGKMGSTGRSTGSHLHFEARGARNPF